MESLHRMFRRDTSTQLSRPNLLAKEDDFHKTSFRSFQMLRAKKDEYQQTQGFTLSPFTLRFTNQDDEKSFRKFYRDGFHHKAQMYLSLVLLVEFLSTIFEFIFLNIHNVILTGPTVLFACLRLLDCLFFVALLLASLTKTFKRGSYMQIGISVVSVISFWVFLVQFVLAYNVMESLSWGVYYMAHTLMLFVYIFSFSTLLFTNAVIISCMVTVVNIIVIAIFMHLEGWLPPIMFGLFFLCTGVVMGTFHYNMERVIRQRFVVERTVALDRKQIDLEKSLSQGLLLNIFPKVIIEKFKRDKATIVEEFSDVTIFFSDVVSFTELSSTKTPSQLVELLNQLFSRFDAIVNKYKLEKIKTIGDAYMAVGGLPIPSPDHAENVADMSLEVLEAVKDFNKKCKNMIGPREWNLRIGLHTGRVVAGVIGKKKYLYDIYGEAATIATEMEASGKPGRIHVSEHTYNYLKNSHDFEEDHPVQLKIRDEVMKTYFLIGKKLPLNKDQPDPNFVEHGEPSAADHAMARMPALSLSIANPIWKHLNQEIEDLSHIKLQRFTLAFPKPEVEKEFEKYYFYKNLNSLRVSLVIIFFLIFMLEIFDPSLHLSSTSGIVIRCVRYVLLAPMVLGSLIYSRFSNFEKQMQWVIMALVVILYASWIMNGFFVHITFGGLAGAHMVGFFMVRLYFKYITIIASIFQVTFIVAGAALEFMEMLGIFLVVTGIFVFGILSIYIFERYLRLTFVNEKLLEKEKERLKIEQAKSEELLVNLLPVSIAQQLKGGEENIAKRHPNVTIMFADVIGLSGREDRLELKELFKLINHIFCKFDDFTEVHKIEKIKTIGSTYMVASGLEDVTDPLQLKREVSKVVETALDMIDFVDEFNENQKTGGMWMSQPLELSIQIGIHIGPVVAGVIGKKKFAYDVWGDAVNIASRMETSSLPKKIQVTEQLFSVVKDDYILEERGEINIKGKGIMKTFFLIGRKNQTVS